MGNFWSQPLRVECKDMPQLITCRTINSRLWFINNQKLEERLLPYLAKYQQKYSAIVYSFSLVGNHYHMLAKFPLGRRSEFLRDFNARVAEVVRRSVPEFLGGPVFERRYTPQVLPLDEDTEKYFFYCALQAVSTGLTERISEYPGYNSFSLAIGSGAKTYRLFNYGDYNAAKRFNPKVAKKDYFEEYTLTYSKLPHLAHLSTLEYRKYMLNELEQKRAKIVADRRAEGKDFLGIKKIKAIVPGSLPRSTKKGGLRPLVLSACKEAKERYLEYYFGIVAAYRDAVARYRRGEFDVAFPPGTFRPHGMCLLL